MVVCRGVYLHLDVLQLHRGRGGIRRKQEHRERCQPGHHQGNGGEEAEDRLSAIERGMHCAGDVVKLCRASVGQSG